MIHTLIVLSSDRVTKISELFGDKAPSITESRCPDKVKNGLELSILLLWAKPKSFLYYAFTEIKLLKLYLIIQFLLCKQPNIY